MIRPLLCLIEKLQVAKLLNQCDGTRPNLSGLSQRHWPLWLCLPRKKKREIDFVIQMTSLLRPLLRNHPEAEEKINRGESYTWPLSEQDASDAKRAVEEYVASKR